MASLSSYAAVDLVADGDRLLRGDCYKSTVNDARLVDSDVRGLVDTLKLSMSVVSGL
jgi:hypothetical protein